jgi:hypothetical protein
MPSSNLPNIEAIDQLPCLFILTEPGSRLSSGKVRKRVPSRASLSLTLAGSGADHTLALYSLSTPPGHYQDVARRDAAGRLSTARVAADQYAFPVGRTALPGGGWEASSGAGTAECGGAGGATGNRV